MAGKSRSRHPAVTAPDSPLQAQTPSSPLPARLLQQPYEYRFFQAVRLLQKLDPSRRPVGRFEDPSREAARFASHQSLGYPPSEIQRLDERPAAPPRLEVSFMGLTGPVGELPVTHTAYVMERLRARDHALADFLDLFNHRLISLFYRAWEKFRFTVAHERREPGGLRQYLLDLLGLGARALQQRQQADDGAFVYYAGLLAQRPRSALALAQWLEDYFDVPLEVQQFVGAWRRLDTHSQCRLEEDTALGSVSSELGVGAVAGDEVWDAQSAVRLRIGPLPLQRYLEFLPNGRAYPALKSMVRFYAGLEFDFEVQLVLRREDAPGFCLGAGGDTAPRLGWVSWMKSVPLDRDPADTIYRLWEES